MLSSVPYAKGSSASDGGKEPTEAVVKKNQAGDCDDTGAVELTNSNIKRVFCCCFLWCRRKTEPSTVVVTSASFERRINTILRSRGHVHHGPHPKPPSPQRRLFPKDSLHSHSSLLSLKYLPLLISLHCAQCPCLFSIARGTSHVSTCACLRVAETHAPGFSYFRASPGLFWRRLECSLRRREGFLPRLQRRRLLNRTAG